MRRLLFILSFTLLSLSAEAFYASVKSMGMAGTAMAYPIDTLAGAYNPAGMPLVGNRIDLGVEALFPSGKTKSNAANKSFHSHASRNVFLGEFGINAVWWGECTLWSLGLLAYPRLVQTRHSHRFNDSFKWKNREQSYTLYTIAPLVAVEFGGCFSLGIALDWEIARLKKQIFHAREHKGSKSNYAHGVTYTFGFRWQIANWLALGGSYQPKAVMSKFKHRRCRLDVPARWGIGFKVHPLDQVVCCLDIEQIEWQNITVQQRLERKRPFRQQNLCRLGIEYQPWENFSLRAGYRWANSLLRHPIAVPYIFAVDVIENEVTAGCSYGFNWMDEISAFYAYGFNRKKSGSSVHSRETRSTFGLSCSWLY